MSTKPAHGITVTRWIRRVLAVVLVYNLGIGIYDFTMGHLFGLISFACVLGLAAVMTYQTKVIHRVERANRPCPDYSVIARMEREVYGETFEHEGAPGQRGRSNPDLSRCDCCHRRVYHGGLCLKCTRQAKVRASAPPVSGAPMTMPPAGSPPRPNRWEDAWQEWLRLAEEAGPGSDAREAS